MAKRPEKAYEVTNGRGPAHLAEREVHFDEKWNPMPVIWASFSGRPSDRSTRQGRGAHYVKLVRGSVDGYIIDGRIAMYTQADRNLLHGLYEKHPWLEAFLETSQTGILPAEYFPPEKYISSKRKLNRLEQDLRKFGLFKHVRPIELLKAKKQDLVFDPVPLPEDWRGPAPESLAITDDKESGDYQVRVFGTSKCGFAEELASPDIAREKGHRYVAVYVKGWRATVLQNGTTIRTGRSLKVYSL